MRRGIVGTVRAVERIYLLLSLLPLIIHQEHGLYLHALQRCAIGNLGKAAIRHDKYFIWKNDYLWSQSKESIDYLPIE